MSFCYLSFSIKLKDNVDLLPAFIIGAILESLKEVFGEIGGLTVPDLLTFDEDGQKGILRVDSDFAVKVRVATTLISEFQGVPVIFRIHRCSTQLTSLTDSFLTI